MFCSGTQEAIGQEIFIWNMHSRVSKLFSGKKTSSGIVKKVLFSWPMI